jgi:hypothetical protein
MRRLGTPPARIFIPAGATGATFDVPTSPVSVPTIVRIDLGDALENYRAPNTVLTLMPAGSPPTAASLAPATGRPRAPSRRRPALLR